MTATVTQEATATETPEPTASHTLAPTATNTATLIPTSTATLTPVFTATATSTPEGTATETPVATATDTPTSIPSSTFTPIFTATATSTPEGTATETPTATQTEVVVSTATSTPIFTATATTMPEGTATETPTPAATDTATQIATFTATSALAGVAEERQVDSRKFTASLSGDNEVPVVTTSAQGTAKLHLSRKGPALRYRVRVAGIADVTQAHIHCGAPGVNGPVVAFLFGPTPAGVDPSRTLASGTITPSDVLTVPDSAACPGGIASFDDLLAKIRAGETYVNVHTLAHPSGEIRGTLV